MIRATRYIYIFAFVKCDFAALSSLAMVEHVRIILRHASYLRFVPKRLSLNCAPLLQRSGLFKFCLTRPSWESQKIFSMRLDCRNFQIVSVKMGFSATAVAFFLSLRCVYASLSSRDLVLETLPNSTEFLYPLSNQTFSNRKAPSLGEVQTAIVFCRQLHGSYLDSDSCENALKKIPLFGVPGQDVEFRPRFQNPSHTAA